MLLFFALEKINFFNFPLACSKFFSRGAKRRADFYGVFGKISNFGEILKEKIEKVAIFS